MKSMHWIAAIGVLVAALVPAQTTPAQDETRPATRPAPTTKEETTRAQVTSSRMSEVIGRELRNARGDALGRVQDLVIDDETGRVAYVVVTGLAEDSGDRLWIVPWDVLSPSPAPAGVPGGERVSRHFLLEMDRTTLGRAPAFRSDAWPVMDRTYGRDIYAFYGRAPYWERERPIRRSTRQGMEELRDDEPRRPTVVDPNRTERDVPPVARPEARELEQFPVGMFEPRNIRIINGAISSIIEQTGPENDFGIGIRLMVKRDDQSAKDPHTLVFVGPSEFVKKQTFELRQHDVLAIKGAEMERGGRKIFVATEITKGDKTMILRHENGMPAWTRRTKLSGEGPDGPR
jgi:sporulation protein YlmC with PRC-barrel domain